MGVRWHDLLAWGPLGESNVYMLWCGLGLGTVIGCDVATPWSHYWLLTDKYSAG